MTLSPAAAAVDTVRTIAENSTPNRPEPPEIVTRADAVYTSAFFSSVCCDAPIWRCLFMRRPEYTVCFECKRECEVVPSRRPV